MFADVQAIQFGNIIFCTDVKLGKSARIVRYTQNIYEGRYECDTFNEGNARK